MSNPWPREGTAVVLPVPAAEPLVRPWRERFDPAAALGVPAHMTLLFPFVPPDAVGPDVVRRLEETFRSVEPFAFHLGGFGEFPGVLWLAPEPDEPIRSLIDLLCREFPPLLPYVGLYDEVTPHLTVLDGAPDDEWAAAREDLEPQLPVHCVAEEAWLMEGDASRWSPRARFPMGG